MKNTLQQKLTSYSLLAGAALVSSNAKANIVYTDIPDQTFSTNGQFYDLDLNNDGTMDFRLSITKILQSNQYSSYTTGIKLNAVSIQPFNNNEAIITGGAYIDALVLNTPINQAANWNVNANNLGYFYSYFYISSSGWGFNSSNSNGNWNNQQNKYIGLKLKVSGKNYYGWFRLDVANQYESFTVKDFAYQDCPDIPIKAGDQGNVNADLALNVNGQDVANNNNASDMEVSFTKAANETKISQYRVMVVKDAVAGSFTIAAAKQVPVASYVTHTPNGNNFSATLAPGFLDTDGDPILQNVPYKVFVLCIPDGMNATALQLAQQTGTVTLTNTIGIEQPITTKPNMFVANKQLTIENVSEEYNGNMLQVYTLNGQLVAATKLTSGNNQLDLSHLSTTTAVLVRIEGANLPTQKFILL